MDIQIYDIYDAEEAAKQTDLIRRKKGENSVRDIFKFINDAVLDGKYSVTLYNKDNPISSAAREYLINLGYKINNCNLPGEESVTICWERNKDESKETKYTYVY